MNFDEIDAIKTQNDPNSCYRPDDEQLYTITEWDGKKLRHQTQLDVIEYVRDELQSVIDELDEAGYVEEAFETAKKYLKPFSGLMEEE